MLSLNQALTFSLAALIIIVIPGPTVLFVVGRALSHGRRTALASVVGNTIGAFVVVCAVAIGIGAIIERSVAVFTVLKLAGAAYLIFLGARALARRGAHAALDAAAGKQRSDLAAVRDGFVVGVTNPKTAVFFAAVLPQFVDRDHGHVPVQMVLLGLIAAVIALCSDSIWSIAASAARAWFGRSERRLRLVGGTGGLAMIGLGVAVALTGRKD